MNGTADADTIADPSVFFSLLCTFAAGLDAAHADNVAADKVRRASCSTSAASVTLEAPSKAGRHRPRHGC